MPFPSPRAGNVFRAKLHTIPSTVRATGVIVRLGVVRALGDAAHVQVAHVVRNLDRAMKLYSEAFDVGPLGGVPFAPAWAGRQVLGG